MDLLTKVNIKPSETKIGYQDRILLLGSCFADNIGEKFSEHYFQATINPFGTLYNPASIMKAMHLSLQKGSKCYMLQHNGLWHSMMHHGSFSHPDKNELLRRCEESWVVMRNALQEASTIIVTFGTSWVYEREGMVVANCHKLPAKEFVRRRLTVDDVVQTWQTLIEQMPDKHWIFTVSPIRHIKDGLHENQISKAILLQAVDCLVSNNKAVSYFPSYEIMLDELRDYRFYSADMLHPSSLAVDYIWQRFVDTYMTIDTQNEMRILHQLWRDRHHRFLYPGTEEAIAFKERTEKRLESFKKQYPWLE
jgi:hypothetical protein